MTTKNTSKKIQDGAKESVEVLYQKMGDRWFAFSLVEDEVFVGSISQEEIDHAEAERANGKKNGVDRSGNA